MMDETTYQRQQAEELAKEILTLSRNTLLVNLRFLDAALCKFVRTPVPITDTLATDGEHLYYDTRHILSLYREGREVPVRDYLHVTLHCVFHHPFIHTLVDMDLWDLACDIAVENVINELGLKAVEAPRQSAQAALIGDLKEQLTVLNAEKIYRWLLDAQLPPETVKRWREDFLADDHDIWYIRGKSAPEGDGEATGSDTKRAPDQTGKGSPRSSDDSRLAGNQHSREELEQEWEDISRRSQVELETANRQWGDQAGSLVQNLRAVNREKYDYSDFLRQFAVLNEAMKINDEEFDYIYYTYGLELYENLPLIEPLEYQEIRQIREFVIAIDTSGSVSGETVQRFITKTYNILRSAENFASRVNIHIIQCDAEIQEDRKITTTEEFDEYLNTMTLHGFGGTDFRPVFQYVDELIAQKELTNLRGLIYFTDGRGAFLERPPQYHTAFVFLDDGFTDPKVPVWASKLILQPEELEEI